VTQCGGRHSSLANSDESTRRTAAKTFVEVGALVHYFTAPLVMPPTM
jgi:hypothetical protein